MADLRADAQKPTNLAKVYDVSQESDDDPAVFLEWILNAFHHFRNLDPEEAENSNTVALVCIYSSAPDIRRKLQKLERLGEKTLRDLVEVAEKMYHNRETKDEKKIKTGKILNRDLAKILLANNILDQRERKCQFQSMAEGKGPTGGH